MEMDLDQIASETDYYLKLGFEDLATNEDRFIWAKKHLITNVVTINDGAEAVKKFSKSASDSEKYRTEGNKYFKDKLYKEALDLYTQSMIAAPAPTEGDNGDRHLAKSLCNRSAALFYLEEYKACVIDIYDAMQAGYPEERQYLLYTRKAKCLHAMQLHEEADLAFEKVVELLPMSNVEQRNSILKELENHLATSVEMLNPRITESERVNMGLPGLPYGRNASHPSLSSSCKVKYNTDEGRYVVATRDIRPGEVILVEEPYSASLAQDRYEEHCDNCFCRPPIAPTSCQHCRQVLFCNTSCRDNAWAHHHKYECSTDIRLYHHTLEYRLALRTALVAGLDEMLKYKDKLATPPTMHGDMTGCNEQGQYRSNDFNTINHLVDHFDKLSKRDMFEITFWAVSLETHLESLNFFHGIPPEEKEAAIVCVGKCLMHINQAIKATVIAISEQQVSKRPCPSIMFSEVGIALYPTCALLSHSCASNIFFVSYGKNAVIHAKRTIKEGEKITAVYSEVNYLVMQKEKRQQILQDSFYFKCSCEACTNNWPLYSAMKCQPPQFKCTNCQHPLCTSTGGHPQGGKVCPACTQRQDISALMEVLQNSRMRIQQASKHFSSREVSINFLSPEMEKLENLLVLPEIETEFLNCIECLRLYCCLFGNRYIGPP